jgi:voltage-gated potassium channel
MDAARERWMRSDLEQLTLRRAVVVVISVATLLALAAALLERLVDPAFDNMGDALWWAVVTVSTVGYGDFVPESTAGRLIGSALMLVGLGFIPLITSVVVSVLVAQRNREVREQALRDLAVILERLDRIEQRLPEPGPTR